MHPGTLVNSTAVGGAWCLRRTVLQTVVPDGVAATTRRRSKDATTTSARVADGRAFNTGPGAIGFYKHAERIVGQRVASVRGGRPGERSPGAPALRRAGRAQGAARCPAAARRAAFKSARAPRRGWWVLDGPGAGRGNVVLTKMVDAEETVWAPRLGLRGVVDAVAVGKLEQAGERRPNGGANGTACRGPLLRIVPWSSRRRHALACGTARSSCRTR